MLHKTKTMADNLMKFLEIYLELFLLSVILEEKSKLG